MALMNCGMNLLMNLILRATPSAAGAWCLHFDILGDHFCISGAPRGAILAPRDCPGGPWGQQDGHEVVPVYSLFDFKNVEIACCFWLVSTLLFDRFLSWHFDAWDSKFEVSAMNVLRKSTFHRNRFLWMSGRLFLFCGGLGGCFFEPCKQAWKKREFWRVQRSSSRWFGEAYLHGIWILITDNSW